MDIAGTARTARTLFLTNSPSILTACAVGGVVTTAVLAIRATAKSITHIEENEVVLDRKLTNREQVELVWMNYVPTIVMGGLTITCMISANSINLKRNAALASVYSLTDTAFREYRNRVVENLGETREKKMRDDLAEEKMAQDPVSRKEVIVTGTGDNRCYDTLTGRYFMSDIETIRRAVNDVNALILREDSASQNEFYSRIGLRPVQFGEETGWNVDNLLDVSFSSHLSEDGVPCLALVYDVSPRSWYFKHR